MSSATALANNDTMRLKTRITELLGIDYPILQGGMMWMGRAESFSTSARPCDMPCPRSA